MILFVFEGKDDKTYFESIKWLFLSKKSDTFVCTYNSNIYSLYTKLMEHLKLIPYLCLRRFSLKRYVKTEECKVAILNAFPIFLFGYFGRKMISKLLHA